MVQSGTRTRGLVALLLMLAALAATVTACGGNDEDAGAAAATAPAKTAAPADIKWRKVVPGGDCECADGSEFAFWERRADPTKVVFFLDGGGACYDAATCRFTGLGAGGEANYDWSIHGEDPASEGGIFDFDRADNPFRDDSFIYVPACTGDAHLGDVTRKYSPRLTVEHNGFVNGTAALNLPRRELPRRRPGRRRRQERWVDRRPHLRRPRLRPAPRRPGHRLRRPVRPHSRRPRPQRRDPR